MIDPSWISGLGVILFGIGLLGAFTRKNAIIVLMCIEVMLNAANLNFVAGGFALWGCRRLGIHCNSNSNCCSRSCNWSSNITFIIQYTGDNLS